MKSESKIFLFLVIFFLVVTPLYVIMTWQIDGFVEPIGTTALAMTLLFLTLIAWPFRPSARARNEEAANMIFKEDEHG